MFEDLKGKIEYCNFITILSPFWHQCWQVSHKYIIWKPQALSLNDPEETEQKIFSRTGIPQKHALILSISADIHMYVFTKNN